MILVNQESKGRTPHVYAFLGCLFGTSFKDAMTQNDTKQARLEPLRPNIFLWRPTLVFDYEGSFESSGRKYMGIQDARTDRSSLIQASPATHQHPTRKSHAGQHASRWFVKASSCPLCKNDLKMCGRSRWRWRCHKTERQSTSQIGGEKTIHDHNAIKYDGINFCQLIQWIQSEYCSCH